MKIKIEKPDRKRLISFAVYIAVIAAGILLDQLTKSLAVKHLMGKPSVPFIDGVLRWTYVENRGAAWGIFDDQRWIFMSISTVAILGMTAYLFLFLKNGNILYQLALPLLISGGIGNMIDRIILGYVVDFIDFCLIDFPVFNVADSIVCIGAGLLILALILDIVKESRQLAASKDGEDKK